MVRSPLDGTSHEGFMNSSGIVNYELLMHYNTMKTLHSIFLLFLFTLGACHLATAQDIDAKKLEAQLKGSKNTTKKVDILNKLAEVYKGQKEFKKGQNKVNQAISLAKKLNYSLGLAEAYHQQGAIYANQQKFKEALKNFQQSLELFRKNKNALKIAILLNKIGGVYYYLKDYPKAIENISASAKKYESLKLQKDADQLRAYIGIVYAEQKDYPNALKYYKVAQESYQKNKQVAEEANILVNISAVYIQQKELNQSLKALKRSLQLFDQLKAFPQKANVAERIADNHLSLQEYEQGEKHLKIALDIYEKAGQKQAAARLYKQLAGLYYNQKKVEDALKFNVKLVEYLKTLKNDKRLETELTNVGILYRITEKYDKALEYYKQSLELRKKSKDKSAEAAILVNIGEAHALKKNIGESLKAFSQSLKIREELKDTTNIIEVLQQFARLYNGIKEYRRVGGILEKAYKIREIQVKNGSYSNDKLRDLIKDVSIAYYKADKFEKVYFYENKLLEIHKQKQDEANIAQTMLNLGVCSEKMQRNSEAIDYYEQAHQKFKKLGEQAASAKALYNSAKLYLKLKNEAKAIEKLKQTLPVYEQLQNKEAIMIIADEIAHLYKARKQFKEALVYFKKADNYVEKPENEVKILQSLSICYFNLKQYEEALKATEELTQLKPKNARFHNNLGLVLAQMKRYKEAIQAFKKATTLANDATYNFGLAWAYLHSKDYKNAMKEFDLCAEKEPSSVSVQAYRSYIFIKTGQLDKAKEILEKIESLNVKSAFMHIGWIAYYLTKKQKDKAKEYLQKGVKLKLVSDEKEVLKNDPLFDPIRGSKNYKIMVRD